MAGDKVKLDKDTVVGSWRIRRLFMFSVSGFSMWMIYKALDEKLIGTVAEIVVQSSYWLLFGIIALYVFGVTVQDIVALVKGYKYGSSVGEESNQTNKK